MEIKDLLATNRSYRRFYEDQPLNPRTLAELVELTRLCPSSANRQPLKYLLVSTREENAWVFETLAWAGALPDWPGPTEGERPTGYIVILGDTEVSKHFDIDAGINAQSMLLGAAERGLGGCMIGSIQRDKLRQAFHIPDRFTIVLILALGAPKEEVVLENAKNPDAIDYWRDEQDVHHVPKRPMGELLVRFT